MSSQKLIFNHILKCINCNNTIFIQFHAGSANKQPSSQHHIAWCKSNVNLDCLIKFSHLKNILLIYFISYFRFLETMSTMGSYNYPIKIVTLIKIIFVMKIIHFERSFCAIFRKDLICKKYYHEKMWNLKFLHF